MNGDSQPDKFDWIKFEQPWAARRAKPMDGWSNGEIQVVIRNGMDAWNNRLGNILYTSNSVIVLTAKKCRMHKQVTS